MALRNKVTEKDIRDWLDQNGFRGNSARFEELELHAISRSGWIQLFRFCLSVNPIEGEGRTHLYGSVLDDERNRDSVTRTKVQTFDSIDDLNCHLGQQSEGLLVRQVGQNGNPLWVVLIGGLLIGFVLLVLNLLK